MRGIEAPCSNAEDVSDNGVGDSFSRMLSVKLHSIVRRQGFWNRLQLRLSEYLAHLIA